MKPRKPNHPEKESVFQKKHRLRLEKVTDEQAKIFATKNSISLTDGSQIEGVKRSIVELYEGTEALPQWMADEPAFADLVRARNCDLPPVLK
jgi:hypothetical protein